MPAAQHAETVRARPLHATLRMRTHVMLPLFDVSQGADHVRHAGTVPCW
jgi:hypothetical protein